MLLFVFSPSDLKKILPHNIEVLFDVKMQWWARQISDILRSLSAVTVIDAKRRFLGSCCAVYI